MRNFLARVMMAWVWMACWGVHQLHQGVGVRQIGFVPLGGSPLLGTTAMRILFSLLDPQSDTVRCSHGSRDFAQVARENQSESALSFQAWHVVPNRWGEYLRVISLLWANLSQR